MYGSVPVQNGSVLGQFKPSLRRSCHHPQRSSPKKKKQKNKTQIISNCGFKSLTTKESFKSYISCFEKCNALNKSHLLSNDLFSPVYTISATSIGTGKTRAARSLGRQIDRDILLLGTLMLIPYLSPQELLFGAVEVCVCTHMHMSTRRDRWWCQKSCKAFKILLHEKHSITGALVSQGCHNK